MVRKIIISFSVLIIFSLNSHARNIFTIGNSLIENRTQNMDCYDVTYYGLNLGLNPAAHHISGAITIKLKVISGISELEFHLKDNMVVDSIRQNNLLLNFSLNDDILSITLNRDYSPDELIAVEIFYHGSPEGGNFLSGLLDRKPIICTNNLPFGARTWFPCKDLPYDKADSMDVILTVPEKYVAVSCGKLIEEKTVADNKKQYWWHEKYPIATFSVGISVYEYEIRKDIIVIEGDTLELYFYYSPKYLSRFEEIFNTTKEMIQCYSDILGKYPFIDEKYAMVQTIWGHREIGERFISHQTFTDFVLDDYNYIFYDDAMTAQWFGQMISCYDFHHIWLMTGAIEWGRYLYYDWQTGGTLNRTFQEATLKDFEYGTVYVEDQEDSSEYDWRLIISKASWAINMLRFTTGEANFFKSLRAFCKDPRYKYGTATTEQFQQVFEQVSEMDLSWFFQQWIYDVGYPTFQFRYKIVQTGENNFEISGVIEQIQTSYRIFTTPINITIKSSAGDSTLAFWIDKKQESFSIKTSKEPKALILNEDHWIVCEVKTIDKSEIVFNYYELNDSLGNGDQHLDAGEVVKLCFSVSNNGVRVITPQIKLTTASSAITLIDSVFTVNTIDYNSTFTSTDNSFAFSINDSVTSCFIPLQLSIIENGENIWQKEFVLYAGESYLLLVNSDFWAHSEMAYREILANLSIPYHYCNKHMSGLPDSLENFRKIILFTGETKDSLLSDADQNKIMEYLDKGGNLLICSSNLASSLATSGSPRDSIFLASYLGVHYLGEKLSDTLAVGVIEDTIADRYVAYLHSRDPNNNLILRDAIEPTSPAVSIFNYYPSQNCAGIRLTDQKRKSRLVYLPFGLEEVKDIGLNTSENLLLRIMGWFDSSISYVRKITNYSPSSFALMQNYPNPFNSNTRIDYQIANLKSQNLCSTTLRIYDINGQLVKTLVVEKKKPGFYSIIWHGEDENNTPVASGVYLIRMKVDQYSTYRKMILLR
ncbi:MAG: T9SS type A sorting domain-containing protein [Calditrichaeota bacterium]|nr:T9SS type A sorting domain-containing protein [Calditrichota bacterium]